VLVRCLGVVDPVFRLDPFFRWSLVCRPSLRTRPEIPQRCGICLSICYNTKMTPVCCPCNVPVPVLFFFFWSQYLLLDLCPPPCNPCPLTGLTGGAKRILALYSVLPVEVLSGPPPPSFFSGGGWIFFSSLMTSIVGLVVDWECWSLAAHLRVLFSLIRSTVGGFFPPPHPPPNPNPRVIRWRILSFSSSSRNGSTFPFVSMEVLCLGKSRPLRPMREGRCGWGGWLFGDGCLVFCPPIARL